MTLSFCLLDLNKDTYTAQDMKTHTGGSHTYFRYEQQINK